MWKIKYFYIKCREKSSYAVYLLWEWRVYCGRRCRLWGGAGGWAGALHVSVGNVEQVRVLGRVVRVKGGLQDRAEWEVRGKRWEVRGKRWEVRGERWEVRGERWEVRGLIVTCDMELCDKVLPPDWLNLELSLCFRILLGCMRLCWSLEVMPAHNSQSPPSCPAAYQLYCHCSCPALRTSSDTPADSSSKNCRRSETKLGLNTSCWPRSCKYVHNP